ncbi:MAG TPA: permease [Spongiibacteraceae bacterium]|nr:permease [Spongiibacteraceae bacterium]HCS29368.1 permease [Spongiibacteraceae bacterium]
MHDLQWYQYALIGLIFVWSGFVRSGLGFGGAVLSLPFLLLVHNDALVFLPLISVHLLVFSSITVVQNNRKPDAGGTVDWRYLRYLLAIMMVPKLIGVFGLITLPAKILSGVIFSIVSVYSLSYIFNRPFRSNSRIIDTVFLLLGGYISGTSLIGAPLIIAVAAQHVAKTQLRDTLFVLWFVLVTIKMAAFVYFDIDLQLIHHLWLLPCAAIGHVIGLRFHDHMLNADTPVFFRVLGSTLLLISLLGLARAFLA